MIVYRICKKEEIQEIFRDNSFTNVGSYSCDSNLNTHHYDKNNKYLHFFLNKDSIFYLRTLKDRYICVYDMPEDILEQYKGIGYYWDYINYKNLNEVIEYAVEISNIKMAYLKQIGYIKQDLDYEDFLEDDVLMGYVDVIYNNISEKRLVLKNKLEI